MLCFVEKFRILFSKLTASKAICTLMYVLISCTVVFKYQLIVGKCSHLLLLGVFASGGLTYFFCKVKIPHFQRSFEAVTFEGRNVANQQKYIKSTCTTKILPPTL